MSHADSGTRNTNVMTILCRMYVGSLYKQDASNKKWWVNVACCDLKQNTN